MLSQDYIPTSVELIWLINDNDFQMVLKFNKLHTS